MDATRFYGYLAFLVQKNVRRQDRDVKFGFVGHGYRGRFLENCKRGNPLYLVCG